MNSSDILGKVDSNSVKSASIDYDLKENPPAFPAGMDDDDDFSSFFDDGDDFFGGGDTGSTDFGGSTGFGGSTDFGGGVMGSGLPSWTNNGLGTTQQTQTVQDKPGLEDVAFDVAKSFGTGSLEFIKDFVNSFKGNPARIYTKCGAKVMILGGVELVLGLLLLILKKPAGWDFLISCIMTEIAGIGMLTFFYNKAKEEAENGVSGTPSFTPEAMEDNSDDFFDDEEELDMFDSDEDELDIFSGDSDEDDIFGGNSLDDEDDIFGGSSDDDSFSFTPTVSIDEPKDMDEVLDEVHVEGNGIYTRDYIYSKVMEVLMNITPNYTEVTKIDNDSEVFRTLNYICVEAAKLQISNEKELPHLLEAEETLQYILLTIERVKGIKNTNSYADEISSVYAIDEKTGKKKKGVYATAFTLLNKIVVKIYKGDTSMISLKDLFTKNKDFILDMSNKLPVILGIDGNGETVTVDFKDMDSLLIAGEPRTGKSWLAQAILLQLCMWSSPAEVIFYICDPKDGISDFKSFVLPHVKKFVTEDNAIIQTLRDVVKVEAPRRKKIIGDEKNVNIWDYKKKNPDVEMPILYVVIDEVMTLSKRMDNDTKKEFQGLLAELTSQLPALGIRLIIVPHLVKDQIISKDVTDLMPCRISVMGGASHIERTCGEKNFPHKLDNKGNCCVKLKGRDAEFVRSAVISDDNLKNNDMFDFMRRLWTKIDPEACENSVADEADKEKAINDLIKSSMDDIDDLFA